MLKRRHIGALTITGFALIAAIVVFAGGFEYNEAANWQHVQYPNGKIAIRDKAGWYPKWFGKVTTYPREAEIFFGEIVNTETGEVSKRPVVRTSFSDNGEGFNSGYIRLSTPTDNTQREAFHKKYRGIQGAMTAVFNYGTKTMKVTGPAMTASEHKQSRKAEFLAMLEDQVNNGTYQYTQEKVDDPFGTMQDVEVVVDGAVQIDSEGEPIMRREIVQNLANVVIRDSSGAAMRSGVPPYAEFGVVITQFDITKTDYDPRSNELFAARQNALLKAQQFKADQDAARQEAGKVRETKLMELAEIVGEANKDKEKATIAAEKTREMATIAAKQKADVAFELQREADNLAEKARIEAQMRVDVAVLDLEAAQKKAEAIERLAAAEEERIQKAGAITEVQRAELDTYKERDAMVAEAISRITSPSVVFNGSGSNGNGHGDSVAGFGDGVEGSMINLLLLRELGLLEKSFLTPQRTASTGNPGRIQVAQN